MIEKTRLSQLIVGVLLVGLFLAMSAPAYAGRGGFGGGGMGMSGGGMSGGGFHGGVGTGGSGFRGGRGGYASSGFHGGHSFHGNKFHRCCVNGVFFTGFAFGGGFWAPYYYPYPEDWYPPYPYMPYPYSRYELRGPSRWEWVPNNASAPSSVAPASSRTTESSPVNLSVRGLYHWTDENGVTHWTQGLEGVPEKYRPKAGSGVSTGGGTL